MEERGDWCDCSAVGIRFRRESLIGGCSALDTMAEECFSDLNCTGNEVCYRNVAWLNDGVGSICGCNAFWGWMNPPECDEYGPGSYLIMVTSGINVVIGTLAILLAVVDGISFCRFRGAPLDLKMCFGYTAAAMFFVVLWNGATLGNAAAARVSTSLILEAIIGEYRRSDPTEEKFAPYEDLEGLFGYMASVFSILSYSNISLVWWGAVRNAQSMRRYQKGDKLRYAVRIFQVGFIIALVPPVVLQNFTAGIFLVIGGQTIVFLAYFFALWKFIRLLNTTPDSEKYDKLINALRNNAIVVTLFIFIQTVSSVAYVTYQSQGWKQSSPIGEISPYVITRQITFIAGTVANFAIYMYLHGVIKGRVERLKSFKEEVRKVTEKEYTIATQNF